jgi:hypothetical protein
VVACDRLDVWEAGTDPVGDMVGPAHAGYAVDILGPGLPPRASPDVASWPDHCGRGRIHHRGTARARPRPTPTPPHLLNEPAQRRATRPLRPQRA